MKKVSLNERIRALLIDVKVEARLFVTRDDGITVFDSVQDRTTNSVAALVSGVWQASEALSGIVHNGQDPMDFRFGFDTSSQGVYLLPLMIAGKKYFLGAIYVNSLNPGQLKRQVCVIKEKLEAEFIHEPVLKKNLIREGYLFTDITDEEIDRLFAAGGI